MAAARIPARAGHSPTNTWAFVELTLRPQFDRGAERPVARGRLVRPGGPGLAGMDGNRTHLGRLSTAPRTVLKMGPGRPGGSRRGVPGAAGERAAVRAGPGPSGRCWGVWHTGWHTL